MWNLDFDSQSLNSTENVCLSRTCLTITTTKFITLKQLSFPSKTIFRLAHSAFELMSFSVETVDVHCMCASQSLISLRQTTDDTVLFVGDVASETQTLF
jgi:hypothetical protein